MNDPGAPARSRIGIPNSHSILFLRLTASALISAQKKQRLISTVIPFTRPMPRTAQLNRLPDLGNRDLLPAISITALWIPCRIPKVRRF
jgi:hypothetical protein